MKNIEIREKRICKLIAINLHADLFSSASYLCIQQQTMSMPALSRLLEAIAKSIKHATAMSTILATEIFQGRRDAVLATSKILLDNSSHELRKASINSKTLFGNKIKEVAKGNLQAQQQRFLATSSVATTIQQQKVTYPAPPVFKKPKQPTKPSRPQQMQPYRPKSQTKSYSSSRMEYAKRSGNQKQFPSSKQASSSTKFWSTASPTTFRHSSGRMVGPFCGTIRRIDRQQVGPLYRPKWVQDPIQVSSSPIGCSDISESIFLSVIVRRDRTTS